MIPLTPKLLLTLPSVQETCAILHMRHNYNYTRTSQSD
jgi:hypothetical protein